MEAPPDWDLLAVVRSCYSSTTGADIHPPPPPLPPPPPQEPPSFSPSTPTSVSSPTGVLFRFPNPFESPTTSFLSPPQDLRDICNKPLISNPAVSTFQTVSLSSPVSPSFIAGKSFPIGGEQPQLLRPIKPSTHVSFGAPPTSTSTAAGGASQTQKTKKRKNLMKKVCHVPTEGLSSDMWAWRKYGQKPIKGSPYPRGYYRCSSSKGCLARKQVERNRSDPKMFIVTYTSEHNHPMPTHRNSLAGSTRQKPFSSTAAADAATTAGARLSPLTENSESKKEISEEDNEMDISDLILNDDFYVGFEQIDRDDGSDSFSDDFSPQLEFPWLLTNSGTAAAAGGS